MPFEGNLNVNEVTYYDPVPTSMVANDDVDLQVVALEILRRRGLPVTAHYLCERGRRTCSAARWIRRGQRDTHHRPVRAPFRQIFQQVRRGHGRGHPQ